MGVDPDAQAEPAPEQRAVVNRFVAAFERADVAESTALLAHDVVIVIQFVTLDGVVEDPTVRQSSIRSPPPMPSISTGCS